MNQITIRYPTGGMTLNVPLFWEQSPMVNVEKVFKLLFSEAFYMDNRESIEALAYNLPQWETDTKAAAVEAEAALKAGWRDPKSYTKKKAAEIKAANETLTKNANAAKRTHDKAVRVNKAFNELKSKLYD